MKNKQPTPQLEVKTLLNRTQHFGGFIYHSIRLRGSGGSLRVEVKIPPHRGIRGKCSTCQRPGPGYDSLEERRWLFVPLWGIVVHFFYPPRRGECPEPGVGVEPIPWSQGQRRVTTARMGFGARWARRRSWRETARTFPTGWEAVYHSVEWFVAWGRAHRRLEAVPSIGLDEIHWGPGKRADRFLTVIDQIDQPCRRLLWGGRRRTKSTLLRGWKGLGPTAVELRTDRERAVASPSPRRTGRGLGRGDSLELKRTSSPRPTPPLAGGEGEAATSRAGPSLIQRQWADVQALADKLDELINTLNA